jgi:hypothetical protein
MRYLILRRIQEGDKLSQLFIVFDVLRLTLMKGDKVVESAEKGAYFSLLILSFGITNIRVPHCRF